MNGKEIGLEISKMVNTFNCSEDVCDMLNTLLNDHRTLQQTFCGKFVLNYIRKMALKYKDDMYDGRNESAVKCCSIMWEALKSEYPDWFQDDKQVTLSII
jgi:hypothetical protein